MHETVRNRVPGFFYGVWHIFLYWYGSAYVCADVYLQSVSKRDPLPQLPLPHRLRNTTLIALLRHRWIQHHLVCDMNQTQYNVCMMIIAVLQVCASTMKLFILQALFLPHIVIAFSPVMHWNWIASQQVLCVLAKSWLNDDRWIRSALFWLMFNVLFSRFCQSVVFGLKRLMRACKLIAHFSALCWASCLVHNWLWATCMCITHFICMRLTTPCLHGFGNGASNLLHDGFNEPRGQYLFINLKMFAFPTVSYSAQQNFCRLVASCHESVLSDCCLSSVCCRLHVVCRGQVNCG
jgi:hypothetical protein